MTSGNYTEEFFPEGGSSFLILVILLSSFSYLFFFLFTFIGFFPSFIHLDCIHSDVASAVTATPWRVVYAYYLPREWVHIDRTRFERVNALTSDHWSSSSSKNLANVDHQNPKHLVGLYFISVSTVGR